MIRRVLTLFAALCVIFAGSFFVLRYYFHEPVDITRLPAGEDAPPLREFEILDNTPEESRSLAREVLLSSPLVIFDRGSATPFTPRTVIIETNRQRALQGLPPLAENKDLNRAAELKVQDLFEGQYFDHISPKGEGPDTLARRAGYEYVSIGENLALGNFGDEGALIDAWMQSPGHRANILRAQFQEIGVAIGRGTFNGRQVLIAVQEFGRPIGSCPSVNSALKTKIEADKVRLTVLADTLELVRSDIDTMASSGRQADAAYRDKVNLYNTQVNEYNALVATIKDRTAAYNDQVRAFNACLKSSS